MTLFIQKANVYVSSMFALAAPGDNFSLDKWQDAFEKSDIVTQILSLQDNSFVVKTKSQNEIMTAKEIKKKALPLSILENYCKLADNRLTDTYKQQNNFCRAQIMENIFDKTVSSATMTIFESGVAMVTLQFCLENSDVEEICSFSRKIFFRQIKDAVEELLQQRFSNLYNRKHFQEIESDHFVSTVLHDCNYKGKYITHFIRENSCDLYSLAAGLSFRGESIHQSKMDQFLATNLSTRCDTFFSWNFNNSLVVESSWKRKNLTQKQIPQNATSEMIDNREEYNDCNYLLWIETLLYQRYFLTQAIHLMKNKQQNSLSFDIKEWMYFQEETLRVAENLEGFMICFDEAYQEWIDKGFLTMGVESRYNTFLRQSQYLYNRVNTLFHHEEITRQNKLSTTGNRISQLAIFFCLLEFCKNVISSFKEYNIANNLFVVEISIYFIFIIAVFCYFSPNFTKSKNIFFGKLSKTP